MPQDVKCLTCREPFSITGRHRNYCTTRCADRARKIRTRYKVTPTQIYQMYKKQKGKCAICGSRGDVQELGYKKYGPFCIDHDHKTGAVRGLLCANCNKGLGMFRDCTEYLKNAIAYLIKHNPIKKKQRTT